MTDPEPIYKSLTSGNPSGLRADEASLNGATRSLNAAQNQVEGAAGVPVWTGEPANAYCGRVIGILHGVAVNRVVLARIEAGLDGAAQAYDTLDFQASWIISAWRNRPSMPSLVDAVFARVCIIALLRVGKDYNAKLQVLDALVRGERVDLDDLDEDTRKWVEQGIEKSGDWRNNDGNGLGPLIPNLITSTGDDRGLIPQGASYDPAGNAIVQGYYRHDGAPVLSLIDEVTGQELTEVNLAGHPGTSGSVPTHVGGVAVDGDRVYVTDNGTVYEYSLKEIRSANPGDVVEQTAIPQDVPGGSYATYEGKYLYTGDFEDDVMYVYKRDPYGYWVEVDRVETPEDVQGVAVHDGKYVFSTSHGRENGSSLIVQDAETGDRSDPHALPNMSQSVMEINGQMVVTYESGAEDYLDPNDDEDADDMWATRYMTTTSLDALGLEPDFEVEPATLRSASRDLEDPAYTLNQLKGIVAGISVSASDFGDVPAATDVANAITAKLSTTKRSLRYGHKAVTLLSEALWNSGDDYDQSDLRIQQAFDKLRA